MRSAKNAVEVRSLRASLCAAFRVFMGVLSARVHVRPCGACACASFPRVCMRVLSARVHERRFGACACASFFAGLRIQTLSVDFHLEHAFYQTELVGCGICRWVRCLVGCAHAVRALRIFAS